MTIVDINLVLFPARFQNPVPLFGVYENGNLPNNFKNVR